MLGRKCLEALASAGPFGAHRGAPSSLGLLILLQRRGSGTEGLLEISFWALGAKDRG